VTGVYRSFLFSLAFHVLLVSVIWNISSGARFRPTVIPVNFILEEREQGRGTGDVKSEGRGKSDEGREKKDEQGRVASIESRALSGKGQEQEQREAARIETRGVEMPVQAAMAARESAGVAPGASDGAREAGTGGAGPGTSAREGSHGGVTASLPGYGSSIGSGAAGSTGSGQIDEKLYGEIRERVMKNVEYPERARRMGIEGRVITSFTIREDGSIADVKVFKSSGSSILDDAAKSALARSSFRGKRGKVVSVMLPIDYRLK
jgi:periplasmic protein TonB